MTVTNPLSAQHAVMRQRVLGSVLDVVAINLRHGRMDLALFEIGKGYGTGTGPDQPTREWWRLAFALTGAAEIPAWSRQERPYDLDDAKGVVELLASRFGHPAPAYAPLVGDPTLHPGRSAAVEAQAAAYQRRRDVLVKGLHEAGWMVDNPKASMYVWAKIPEPYAAMGSLEFTKKLIEKAKVSVSPGIGFGEFGDGHVRFAMIENEARTRQAIRGIKQMFREDGLL